VLLWLLLQVQLNADYLQLEACAPGARLLKLVDSPQYEMPVQEAIGPQQLTQVGSADPPQVFSKI